MVKNKSLSGNGVYCIVCGKIQDYAVIKSPHSFDSQDFKYSKCKCGSIQPLCLGYGCLDVTELSCPRQENEACLKIIETKFKK